MLDLDYNLIAAWRSIEEVVPYPQYNAGTKDKDKPVYMYPVDSTSNPILILDFDIVNKHGFGLKRGYYEIAADPDYTYLMFIQSGQIKAKIPVIVNELINSYGSEFEWNDDKNDAAPIEASKDLTQGAMVASRTIYRKNYSQKQYAKRQKKYKKGMDPSLYFHSTVEIKYDRQQELYQIIWEKYNTRLIGVIKL